MGKSVQFVGRPSGMIAMIRMRMKGQIMITRDQIIELPKKYAIGKRPLSRVLGWGELTYTRLLEGSMPSPQHEEELLRALGEPLTYLMLLDQAHDSGLVSDTTYEKSRKAAQKLIDEDDTAEEAMKLHAVARYLCMLAKGDITPHALQLLVYYAQGHSFAFMEEPLFEQLPVAGDDGPAYEPVRAWFTFDRVQEAGAVDSEAAKMPLVESERDFLGDVFSRYGVYSATKLQEMACSEAPWRKARKKAAEAGGKPGDAVITAKSMKKYFTKASK